MPGFLVQLGAQIQCPHGGRVQIVPAGGMVMSSNMPVVTLGDVYTVVGCPQQPPLGPPCTTVTWSVGAARVKIGGRPALVQSAVGQCVPNGVPPIIAQTQTRVRGQ
jgi:uncharacterized Zn-binding protein involved in type VI secretion